MCACQQTLGPIWFGSMFVFNEGTKPSPTNKKVGFGFACSHGPKGTLAWTRLKQLFADKATEKIISKGLFIAMPMVDVIRLVLSAGCSPVQQSEAVRISVITVLKYNSSL